MRTLSQLFKMGHIGHGFYITAVICLTALKSTPLPDSSEFNNIIYQTYISVLNGTEVIVRPQKA